MVHLRIVVVAAAGDGTTPPMSGAAVRTARDLAILLGAFARRERPSRAAPSGAANFGTALGFGQIGFAAALVWVLLRR